MTVARVVAIFGCISMPPVYIQAFPFSVPTLNLSHKARVGTIIEVLPSRRESSSCRPNMLSSRSITSSVTPLLSSEETQHEFQQSNRPQQSTTHQNLPSASSLENKNQNDNNTKNDDAFEDALFLERFRRRRDEATSKIQTQIQQRTQLTQLAQTSDPRNVVLSILESLSSPHEPVPYFGYEVLYRCSSRAWREVLRRSVGAESLTETPTISTTSKAAKVPSDNSAAHASMAEDVQQPSARKATDSDSQDALIYRALASSMERPNNQFGILVGMGTDTKDVTAADSNEQSPASISSKESSPVLGNKEDGFTIEFPWDTLDYYDGTAWVECRLRHSKTDALMVAIGWSLKKESLDSCDCTKSESFNGINDKNKNDSVEDGGDGVWLIDGIDWQDFRDMYRPGIGREEWERICG